MDNIIEALQKNEKPFGLMSEAMQAKAREIDGDKVFEVYRLDEWMECGNVPGFQGNFAYRLCDTYEEPEPGVEKCEVMTKTVDGDCYIEGYKWHGSFRPIHYIPNGYVRIGNLYEDGLVRSFPRVYRENSENAYFEFFFRNIERYEVLTPTHVLFRKQ